MISEENFQQHT
ncbi:DNA mismatch repair protein MutS, partial [Haemophilus influenzae]